MITNISVSVKLLHKDYGVSIDRGYLRISGPSALPDDRVSFSMSYVKDFTVTVDETAFSVTDSRTAKELLKFLNF